MKAHVRLLTAVAISLVPLSAFAQLPNPQPAPAIVRLGCLSPQRAFSESAEGKAAIARLTALQDEKARVIDTKNKELQVQEHALQNNEPFLNDDARNQRSNADLKTIGRFRAMERRRMARLESGTYRHGSR
jgi:Skp family chaperone for outer membrane proteins